MVHHRVDSVIGTSFFVKDENWLNGSIPSIPVQVLELEEADVSRLAHVRLLLGSVDTVGVGSANSRIVWHKGEVLWCRGWSDTVVPRVGEENDPVAWSSAREVTAILDIGPFLGRLGHEGPFHHSGWRSLRIRS